MEKKSQYGTLGYITEIDSDKTDGNNSIIIDHNLNYRETGSVNWDTIAIRGAIGSLYTYNYTNERKFTVALQIVDYTFDNDAYEIPRTEAAKMLLRRWCQPKVTSQTDPSLHSPPPVLLFKYTGLTGGYVDTISVSPTHTPIKVVLVDYNIISTELDVWKPKDARDEYNPSVLEVELQLAEVGIEQFRNVNTDG